MPRFLQALKSIGAGRAAEAIVEEAPPTAYSAAIVLLNDVASTIEERVPAWSKSYLASVLGNKSQSEQIFLGAVLLAIILFVFVLPACEVLHEALFGEYDDRDPAMPSPRAYKPAARIADADDSTRSSRSSGSCCSMETIEESEEEYMLEEEEEDEDKKEVETKGGGPGGAVDEGEGKIEMTTKTVAFFPVTRRTLTIHDHTSRRSQ